MAAPISPMLKYSIVYNLLYFPPILIKFVSKFILCKVLYFKAQCLLRMRSPLIADAWRNFAPMAIQNTPSEDSDQPMSEGTLSYVAVR